MAEKKIGKVPNEHGIIGDLLIFDTVLDKQFGFTTFYCLETITFDKFQFSRNIIVEAKSINALKLGKFSYDRTFLNQDAESKWQRTVTGGQEYLISLSKDSKSTKETELTVQQEWNCDYVDLIRHAQYNLSKNRFDIVKLFREDNIHGQAFINLKHSSKGQKFKNKETTIIVDSFLEKNKITEVNVIDV